uniref:Uncharacterized protein n=1 Tax=Rhizophora mucronata TaxID=61149 RepID=A0A2P2PJR8_RHIMU
MRYSPDYLNVSSLFTSLSSRIEGIFLENSLDKNELDAASESLDSEKNVGIADCNEGESDDSGPNHTKLTIVDTSVVNLGKPSVVTELIFSGKASSGITNPLREKVRDYSEDSAQEHVPKTATNLLSNGENKPNKSNGSKGKFDSSASDQKELNSDSRKKLVESVQDWDSLLHENQFPRTLKHQFSRRAKSQHLDNFILPVKRRRLTACSGAEMSRAIKKLSVGPRSNEIGPSCALNLHKAGCHTSQEKFSSSSLEGCPDLESSGGATIAVCSGIEKSHGENVEHQSPSLIDLNVPQVTLESEDRINQPQLEVEKEAMSANIPCLSSDTEKPDSEALGSSSNADPAEAQLTMDHRRKSTRNRPLSIRALEALESKLLNGKKRRRSTQEVPPGSSSNRDRSKVKVRSSSAGIGIADATEQREANEASTNEMDSIGKTPNKYEEM